MEQITNLGGSHDLHDESQNSEEQFNDQNEGLTSTSHHDFETSGNDNRKEVAQEWESESSSSEHAPQQNVGSQANKKDTPTENKDAGKKR